MTVSKQVKRDSKRRYNNPDMSVKTGLYIHIPFCVRKCNYCAFLSFSADDFVRKEYAESLISEIKLRAASECAAKAQNMAQNGCMLTSKSMTDSERGDNERPAIDTVYIGGGTPSVMDVSALSEILESVYGSFDVRPDAEITIEVNPGTLGQEDEAREKLSAYRRIGINRLSMGVQSMDDKRLEFLGRIHTAGDVERDFRIAREAGFDNINLDLIFSVPGEAVEDALIDAGKVIELGSEHVSCYSLQLEEGTAFYKMAEAGQLYEIGDEEDRIAYHRLCELLAASGYERYEISNFARKTSAVGKSTDGGSDSIQNDFRAKHNSLYWDMSDYIGAGLGASGFVNSRRYRNESDLRAYIGMIEDGKLPEAETHENSAFDNLSEAVFTGLRRKEGISYEDALRAYRRAASPEVEASMDMTACDEEMFWHIFADAREDAEAFATDGFLIIDNLGMRLTPEGIDISNRIMSCFV